MKIVVLAAIAALPFSALAQQADEFVSFPDNGVYLSASDFANRKLTDGFDNGQSGYRIRQETFQQTLKVDQPNAPEAKIPLANLWGERKNGVDYRVFDGDLYKVEHTDRLFIYSKPADTWMATSGPAYAGPVYYFSREANSPIHLITSRNLENVYYDQPDKKDAFETIEDQNTTLSDRAIKLIRLFYSTDTHMTHAAE